MYVVALIAAGEVPARYRGVWPVSDIGEDTFGYCVHSTLSTVVRPLRNDSARALNCVFYRWSPVRNFNRLNCISVSVIPVAAPYICVIVTGSNTVPGVTEGKEGGIYVVSQPLLCLYFKFRTP